MVALAGGEDIRCAKYSTFGTRALSKNIIEDIGNRTGCLMEKTGQVTFGNNIEEALDLAKKVENICYQEIHKLKMSERNST